MKETVKHDRRAIPLQTIIIVMILIGILISCILAYYMRQTTKSYRNMRESTEDYTDCQSIGHRSAGRKRRSDEFRTKLCGNGGSAADRALLQ